MSQVLGAIGMDRREETQRKTGEFLDPLIQPDNYVGEVVTLSFEEAVVQVHDHQRERVGGLPSQAFLVATRKAAGDNKDWNDEDAIVILLRVIGPAPLPYEAETLKIRVDAAQRSTEPEKYWDEGQLDLHTRNLLSYAGLKCRVLGTYYVDLQEGNNLIRRFGSDLSNFYAAYALKVYKPTGDALQVIANYRDPDRLAEHPLKEAHVDIGRVRYASVDRGSYQVAQVRVSLAPTDLLRQKTALFGMTRTGKSNTTKIIAKSVFELRYHDAESGAIGQIIFDYNGEYANENVQDNNEALKNVWRLRGAGQSANVVTYGTAPHPYDPQRRLMKENFFAEGTLMVGKQIIDRAIEDRIQTNYVGAFISASLEPPSAEDDEGEQIRYQRRVLAYRAMLAHFSFQVPGNVQPQGRHLFSQELLASMRGSHHDQVEEFRNAADLLGRLSQGEALNWGQVGTALTALNTFITGRDTGYGAFNTSYVNRPNGSGRAWADDHLRGILGMFEYRGARALVRRVLGRHTISVDDDYVDLILADLHAGRLVIVDQSLGDSHLNQIVADRVMDRIFRVHQRIFSEGNDPPEVIVYVEEAHNLLPEGEDFDQDDPRSLWLRVAKEGAKLHIGLVYATQEVSSIHKSILKNTANWFIAHLNNTDETRELVKFYDFSDFQPSILRAQDPGFIRVKTLSNPYIVPTQIDRFQLQGPTEENVHAV
jgi:hypothetical protein